MDTCTTPRYTLLVGVACPARSLMLICRDCHTVFVLVRDRKHSVDDAPSVRGENALIWHTYGVVHRDGDKYAAVHRDGCRLWLKYGRSHRNGKPSIMQPNTGRMMWCENDMKTPACTLRSYWISEAAHLFSGAELRLNWPRNYSVKSA